MFKSTVQNDFRPLIASMAEELSKADYGALFTWDQLIAMAGGIDLKEKRNILTAVAHKLNRYSDKCLVSIKGVGYKILNHNEVADASASLRKSGAKRFKRANKYQETVDLSKLTDTEKQQFINEKVKTAIMLTVYGATENKKQLKGGSTLAIPDQSQIINLILRK